MADRHLILERKYKQKDYTIGNLYRQNTAKSTPVFICNVIEDTVRNPITTKINAFVKVFGETAIPYGTYEVVRSFSPRFKKVLPELLNVPHYTGVRIHAGNSAADSQGCLCPGWNRAKGKVLDSRKAMAEIDEWLEKALKTGKVFIKIVDTL